jgi:uncharacterized membrane protein YccC
MVGMLAFGAGMMTGYGRWALPLSMQALIPMVFVLGLPRAGLAGALRVEALLAVGGFAYIAIALLLTRLTDPSGRRLMASECFRETSVYVEAIARFYDPKVDLTETYGAAIRQQAALSEQIQTARALLLERAAGAKARLRLASTIGILLDVFDALIAAQSEYPGLRSLKAATVLRARTAVALRAAAIDLRRLSLDLLSSERPRLPPDHGLAMDALLREAARVGAQAELDAAARSAVARFSRRLTDALANVRRLELALCDDDVAAAAIGEIDLQAFWPRPSFALRNLTAHFRLGSPVFRFATRLSLAMMAGALVAAALGDQQHGNWVLLTISVVLRANYGLTRQRRDDRVIGTLVGCIVAASLVAYAPIGLTMAALAASLALTHSFVRLNYRLASAGASVTALLSLHLVNPAVPSPILERVADTLIGAAIAHLFSYVLPRWEFDEAPRLAAGLLRQMSAFANVALSPEAADQDYRMARKDMIEAIAALSDSAARMGGEPQTRRRGLDEMAIMLIAAGELSAKISAVRLALREAPAGAHRDAVVAETRSARDALLGKLAAGEPNEQGAAGERNQQARTAPGSDALLEAAATLLSAADDYRQASEP